MRSMLPCRSLPESIQRFPSATPAVLVALSLRADIGPDERSGHRAPSPGEFPRGRYPACATPRNLTGTSCSTSHGNLHQFFALERFALVNLWSMPPAYGSCQIGLLCIRSARGTARKETSPSSSSRPCYTESSVYYLRSHPVSSLSWQLLILGIVLQHRGWSVCRMHSSRWPLCPPTSLLRVHVSLRDTAR